MASGAAGVPDQGGGSAGESPAEAGAGGTIDAGGSAGEGGELADAGASGAGAELTLCSGANAKCPTGQFCDLATNCGPSATAMGVCVPLGKVEDCPDMAGPDGPVCGCDGQFYTNTCQRRAVGMLQAPTGTCSGISTYPTAYGVFQTSRGGAPGPAVVITAGRFARTWDSVAAFPAETPPSVSTGTIPLTLMDTDGLFLRIAGATGGLPHPPAGNSDCHAEFYFRLCDGCAPHMVSYSEIAQVTPEMDSAWEWFDGIYQQNQSVNAVNPGNFCK